MPDYDPRAGSHYWIAPVVFVVPQPRKLFDNANDGPFLMDHENLVYAGPVGCFHCENEYRKGMEHRRCPGEPTHG